MSRKDESRKQARKVMAAFLGIRLPSFAIVHHKNGDPLDNSITNLELVTRGDHSKIHSDDRDQRKGRKSTKGRTLPKGICYATDRHNYKCNIRVGAKRYQARKKTLEEAILWREQMEVIHWFTLEKET